MLSYQSPTTVDKRVPKSRKTTKRLLTKGTYSLETFRKQALLILNMMSVTARKSPSGRPELD
ncbi:hypothetical protein CECT5772_10933 [Streptococcus equi subsp. ruminatorum CECT 5772]|uniref:Uncharacterized protein n=1 Tax=Streptococcus equi subsp. ruminatorum CECT 5772 TaxID=1051981 RepID=A0A922NS18_9STRE|nr:hypothetical protein CECT5772_10933 [Streptococcus equi subsp. ruminatorum CECT 5772]